MQFMTLKTLLRVFVGENLDFPERNCEKWNNDHLPFFLTQCVCSIFTAGVVRIAEIGKNDKLV